MAKYNYYNPGGTASDDFFCFMNDDFFDLMKQLGIDSDGPDNDGFDEELPYADSDPEERYLREIRERNERERHERTRAYEESRKAALEARRAREAEDRRRRQAEEIRRRQEEEEEERRRKHAEEVTCMDLPLDWENAFQTDARAAGVHACSIGDGLILSLINIGAVDIEYIATITGEELKTVIETLKKTGAIFQNPETWGECFYKGWETREEYLSGNLMIKLKAAEAANKSYYGYFSDNIDALRKVMPPAVAKNDIYVTLGSPMVPTYMIDAFIEHLFGRPGWYYPNSDTIHDELTGTWEIPNKSRYGRSITATKTYGTYRIGALHILERTLNMKSVTVRDEVSCQTTKSGVARVVNKEETAAAIEKQKELRREFENWVWRDKKRSDELIGIFTEKYGTIRARQFDGSFLTFPGLNPEFRLHPYQKNAVARIIFTDNTLLAHDVGAGKTCVMIAAGQELRRMGVSKKNMYVVPNNITGQWKSDFTYLYPDAKILVVEPGHFKKENRQKVLQQIRDEDYDGIIIAYSCFEQIPLSKSFYVTKLKDEIARIDAEIGKKTRVPHKLRDARKKLTDELYDLTSEGVSPFGITFDELGITRLFVDEAHNFKNVPINTKTDNVLGINAAGSKKCQDMLDKVRHVQKKNDGKGIIFATGTPITNSITDAYIMQYYLQPAKLALMDIESFDAWIGLFGERVTEFEIDVDTSTYRLASRFAKFHNLPELTSMLASFADFHRTGEDADIPLFDGYSDILIPKTFEFGQYLEQISERADNVRNRRVSRTEDNMLKITGDGRKAALDLRLVEKRAVFSCDSKVASCARIAAEIYHKTSGDKCAQLIFCDTSTPKDEFNIYDELKNLLGVHGVPEDTVAYIHDAATDKKRESLFKSVREGRIRILIGSTFKLGLGVNVQERLIAIHHIDVPWRPADMTQREGRILRQGNTCEKVYIFRYITEGSFDAYSWQLLETKQRFICDLLSGVVAEKSSEDIDGIVLNYAEVKALAVNNPLVKERVETRNSLSKYQALQRKLVESRMRLADELNGIPALISDQETKIAQCRKDINLRAVWERDHLPVPDPELTPEKAEKKILAEQKERRRIFREELAAAVRDNDMEVKERFFKSYRGFDLFLPANMAKDKPFIRIRNNGEYRVELGDTEVGNLQRIDNFLDTLEAYLGKLCDGLHTLRNRKTEIEAELAKDESYADEIEVCKNRLEEIDRKLGIEKND